MDLTTEMKRYLPLYAYPTSALHETLRKLNTPTDARLEISDVLDSGEALGGITCGIHVGDKEMLWVSMTHLDFRDKHPLKEKIKSTASTPA